MPDRVCDFSLSAYYHNEVCIYKKKTKTKYSNITYMYVWYIVCMSGFLYSRGSREFQRHYPHFMLESGKASRGGTKLSIIMCLA